jgi:hypothetical protein
MNMKRIAFLFVAVVMVAGVVGPSPSASGHSDQEAAPIYGVKIPQGYRNWSLISVASVGPPLSDIRAKLGNDLAIKAYREGKLPFPDGAIIARLAWQQVTSEANNNAIRMASGTEKRLTPEQVEKLLDGSFVAGPPTNVQFMVKDSTKYASTGGWGFAQFDDGKPADEATHKTCFPCHEPAKDHDFVFTRYAP